MFIDFIGIDLFDQNVGMAYAEVRLRCVWILLVLIYLIKLWVWYVLRLGSDIRGYHKVLIYLIKMWVWHVLSLGSDVHGYHWYWYI